MIALGFGFALVFLIQGLVGAGPALLLAQGRRRAEAFALAPAIGFIVTTVVGTWLVSFGQPVSRWAWTWTAVAIAASAGSVWLMVRRRETPVTDHTEEAVVIGLFLAVALALVAPQVMGGFRYSMLRGNGSDTINYVGAAEFVDAEPYSTVHDGAQQLVDRHQSYLRAASLVRETRWATFMLLAYTSRCAGFPAYQFEFCFTLLFLLAAAGVAYALARRAGLGCGFAALTAFALSCGFWGQYVQDNRAMSHLNSIPTVLVLIWLLVDIEERKGMARRQYVVLGLAGAAAFVSYPEIMPMVCFGVACFRGRQLWGGCEPRKWITGYLVATIVMVLLLLPAATMLWRFMLRQLEGAANTKVPDLWIRAGLNWLYEQPWLGAWGLAPLTRQAFGSAAYGPAVEFLGTAMGVALTVVLAVGLWPGRFRSGRAHLVATSLLAAMIFAGLAQAGFLLFKQQYWAVGKALSYIYPVVILGVAATALGPVSRFGRWHRAGVMAMRVVVLTWMGIECFLGGYRTILARTGREFENYLWHHGEYRQHDLDFSLLSAAVAREGADPVIWSCISNPTVSEYVAFALGGQARLVSVLPTMDTLTPGVPVQRRNLAPQLLLVERGIAGTGLFPRSAVVAETPELVLLRADAGGAGQPLVVGLYGPGVSVTEVEKVSIAIGAELVRVGVLAPQAGTARLRAEFAVQPASGRDYVPLMVHGDRNQGARLVAITARTEGVDLALEQGYNEISLQLPGSVMGDGRGLLSLVGPSVEFVAPGFHAADAPVIAQFADLGAMSWEPSARPAAGQVARRRQGSEGGSLEVASVGDADLCLVAPWSLAPGLYRVRLVVSGEIEGLPQGAGHFSLHGRSKIVSIPTGEYHAKPFEGYLEVPAEAGPVLVSFGLGGWSLGRGRLVLEQLSAERIH